MPTLLDTALDPLTLVVLACHETEVEAAAPATAYLTREIEDDV